MAGSAAPRRNSEPLTLPWEDDLLLEIFLESGDQRVDKGARTFQPCVQFTDHRGVIGAGIAAGCSQGVSGSPPEERGETGRLTWDKRGGMTPCVRPALGEMLDGDHFDC
ncbi:hypothetical protein Bbelb_179110 [Branchiostoma belcheri]|nr:hypothetical protein Bbelb_179110 [Branchiostoma belcheri]